MLKFEPMDFPAQSPRVAKFHQESLVNKGLTCMDCHKGIAHELPDTTGVEGW